MSGLGFFHLNVRPEFKPGDLPPEGYLDWHEWAEVQRKAGIKQEECASCGKWKTPQELSGRVVESGGKTARGKTARGKVVTWRNPICTKCSERMPGPVTGEINPAPTQGNGDAKETR